MSAGETDVVLAIADISGYTKFMISDKISLMHKQNILTELLNARTPPPHPTPTRTLPRVRVSRGRVRHML